MRQLSSSEFNQVSGGGAVAFSALVFGAIGFSMAPAAAPMMAAAYTLSGTALPFVAYKAWHFNEKQYL